jgi:hypothetical protein
MPISRSIEFAETFLRAFTAKARFLTNLSNPPYWSGWSPVTPHTFDACVIALDDGRVGLRCVADDD